MKLTFEMDTEDPQIDFYDGKDLKRWFCDKEDIIHIVSLIKEELGDEAYVIPDYF